MLEKEKDNDTMGSKRRAKWDFLTGRWLDLGASTHGPRVKLWSGN